MNIIVCVKQVPDPEAPPSGFRIEPKTNTVVPPPGFPPVISTFDEYAVEAALRIKDVQGGKITIITATAHPNRYLMFLHLRNASHAC